MALVSDIVYGALRLCRVRDITNTDRLNEALAAFNFMLKSWGEKMIIPYRESFTLTAGTNSYTIGNGGAFATTRPMSVISAFIQDSSGIDYEVDTQMSVIDYDKIDDKDVSARPGMLYYDKDFTLELGKIYFDYAPSAAETFYLTSYKGIAVYAALTDTVVQPPEYEKALIYNLAVDIAPEYGMSLMPTVMQQAAMLKLDIENRNSLPTALAELDEALLR